MSTHLAQMTLFADYNARFNAQLYEACESIHDEERRRDRGAFFGSIHGTLAHILLGDRIWLGRFRSCGIATEALADAALITSFSGLDAQIVDTWADLRRERSTTDDVISRFVAALDDHTLASPMRYANSRGVTREHPVFVAVAHLFNHQTHHRGQVTTLLKQAGVDPGVTDFLVFATA